MTNSLIHEATTLMEKLFKFWDHHLSVQIAYLIKKGFLKHIMQAMVYGLWKKGNSQAQKVFEGFKRPRININYSSTLFLLLSL